MKHFAKKLSVLLAVLMLFSMTAMLFSCKEKKGGDDTTNTGSVSTGETLSALDVKDFEAREFYMLWPEYLSNEGHFLHNELAADELNSDLIDSAVFTRNVNVKTTYNAEIIVDVQKYSTIPQTVETEYFVGTSSYSAVATVIANMTNIAIKGYLSDYNDLKYYDESQEWWNHDVMQSLSIANKRYFGSGDIIYSDDLYPYVIYVNTALANDLQISDNFYDLVMDKQWTIDKFHELAVLAVGDLDGDGEEAASLKDRFGAVDGASFARALYYSAGSGVISLDRAGYPTWEMTPEYVSDVLSKIIDIWHTDSAVVDVEHQLTDSQKMTAYDIMNLFNSNQVLFMPGDLKAAQAFTTMDNALEDFLVLPIPLWNANSEYVCVMNDAVVLSVPVFAENLDDVSLLLSAMSRESISTLTPAFFETVLTYRYMRNPQSVELLELILDSVVPRDVADIQKWGNFMPEFCNLVIEGSTDFASYYQSNISEARREMDNYITLLDDINK